MSNKKSYYRGYSKEIPENTKVIQIKKGRDKRWAIINADTGEIFDDAQGYGYKTAQNAYKALGYKSRPKEQFDKDEETKIKVRKFCKKHHNYIDLLSELIIEATMHGEDTSTKAIEEMIPDDIKKEMSFSVKDLLRFW